MDIVFNGPASLATDGGINYPTTVNGKPINCYFSYEVLEDVDQDALMGDALTLFRRHQLKLLSIAEQKIINGHTHDGKIEIFTNDLPSD
jgi:hypothetical protein